MPVVTVEMWEGRTKEQKEEIIKGITGALEKVGILKEQTTVIIHDIPKTNWGMKGEQASKVK